MRFAAGFLTAIVLLVLVGLGLIWTGAYNIAASTGHSGVGQWLFGTAMRNSVEARAEPSMMSAELLRTADLRAGFQEFQEYCVHCHGTPGSQPHEWTRGMTPSPPELSQAAGRWSPAEIFWIVKHGIKMTGMPAFGDSESDETIRNIAAFVDRMEGMSPERYQQLQQQWGSGEGGHEHGGGGDGHGSHSH